MTTFNYSSGDPSNLTGGADADMTDISGPFSDIVTFVNGNIDTSNLATSAKPVTILGQYRTIAELNVLSTAGDSSGHKTTTYSSVGLVLLTSGVSDTSGKPFLYLDPADYAVSGLTTKYRFRAAVATNATAPAITYTFGLYPVTTAGGAGTQAFTLGTVTSGSTVAIASPSASTVTGGTGSDFTPPSAGGYVLGVQLSGAPAANSRNFLYLALQVHHV